MQRGDAARVWFGSHAGQTGTISGKSEDGRMTQIKLDCGGYALVHTAYTEENHDGR